jgi:hypothetical protein
MPKVIQLTVTAPTKPGVLSSVGNALNGAGVNIAALCAGETAGRGKIRMLVSDLAQAKKALAEVKIRCGEEPALLLTLPDKPGSLAGVAEKLAKARINIKCAYATTGAAGGQAQVVLVVADPAKAERALG